MSDAIVLSAISANMYDSACETDTADQTNASYTDTADEDGSPSSSAVSGMTDAEKKMFFIIMSLS
jgi:hypothetical protein